MQNNIRTILYLSTAGLLFSGYLSGVKLFAERCALDSSCATFLGVSTCYYGFGLFLILFSSSIYSLAKKTFLPIKKCILPISFVGVLFSGYFSITEIIAALDTGFTGLLYLPTCVYGLLVYIAIFYFALKQK